jgi:15,16-dihydrobiliverdin:ferredoxin oxidoreductase
MKESLCFVLLLVHLSSLVYGFGLSPAAAPALRSLSRSKSNICLLKKYQPDGLRVSFPRILCSSSKPEVQSFERLNSIPWKESVAGAQHRLLYMPFIEYMIQFMKKHLELKDLPLDVDLAYQKSTGPKKDALIESWQFSSKEFRKIRLTYIDAGEQAQVFNSVWYPQYSYDAPVFGIDFLSFGKNRVLAILDLQPLKQDDGSVGTYIDPLIPLRNKYEKLAGRMSGKFYDETRFFSRQLLFGKFDNDGPVMSDLFPAMKEYMDYYMNLMRGLTPSTDPSFIAEVAKLHKDYDQYSAEKDPAVGLFTNYFGADWAERFTHEFLFDQSSPPTPERREELKRERAAQMERQRAGEAAAAAAKAAAAAAKPAAGGGGHA